MDMSFEEKVRERAYHIWMSAGMTEGLAHEHWLSAEAAVRDEGKVPAVKVVKRAAATPTSAQPGKAAAKKTAARKPAAKKTIAKH